MKRWAWILLAALVGAHGPARVLEAARVVVIGDSMSAEYEALPDFPGVDNPTEYARVTVPGWESMSWVEILAKIRKEFFGFGRYRPDLPGWADLRFSGYEFNFAIPGFTAANYADVVESSLFSNPQFVGFRLVLEETIQEKAQWVVIGLGANEFRGQYGTFYDGGDPSKLIKNLIKHLLTIIEFVQEQKPNIPIVLLNLPDLGATPAKQAAHPNRTKRARVTAAIMQANQSIADLARTHGAAVADLFGQTRPLTEDQPTFFGGVPLINDLDADNNPRYHFARDGLHPNTCSQIEMARTIITSLNGAFHAGIPQIRDGEALAFLGIDPDQAYLDWAAEFQLKQAGMKDDPDKDGWVNLAEYALGGEPLVNGAPPIRFTWEQEVLNLTFRPDPKRTRHVQVWPQWSADLIRWEDLPASQIQAVVDQSLRGSLPGSTGTGFLRLRISVVPPE